MRVLIGLILGVGLGWSAAWYFGFGSSDSSDDSGPESQRSPSTTATVPEPKSPLTTTPVVPVKDAAESTQPDAPAGASPRAEANRPKPLEELPLAFGCYRTLADMPTDLREEAIAIVGEESAMQFELLYFGEYEFRTVSIQPKPESAEAYQATGDWIAALDARSTLIRAFIEETEASGGATRFATLEEARSFADQNEQRIARRSLSGEDFIVVDISDLQTTREFRQADTLLNDCRASIRQNGLMVSSYGYDR